jgi:TolA protein
MRVALTLSVLLHLLLLSIPIQGDVFGLSGLRLPWEERRLAASDLQIVLAPAAPATPPAPVVAPRPLPPPAPALVPRERPAAAAPARAEQKPEPRAEPETEPEPEPEPDRHAAEPSRQVELIALAREQAEREASARVELDRIAAERREAARQEQEKRDALARQEEEHAAAARLEAERLERERLDAVRREQEAARQEAIQQELARQELARQEQARQEQARLEEAQREQERARQAQAQATHAPAQQVPADRGQAAQLAPRAERLRAIAEQLARESAGRDRAGSAPGVPPPTVSGLRRGWLFGRSDPNQDLVQYAQAMGRKIELNRTLDMVREAVKQPHTQPVVTVAVRADGSVEKVTFETSSGVAAIDDGIRKIIASQAPYGPFPPALARQYDVVEIRRTWLFDVAVRLQ